MKVSKTNQNEFLLTAETAEDYDFIAGVDVNGRYLHALGTVRLPSDEGGFVPVSATLSINHSDKWSLDRESGRKALCAIRDLSGLLLGELAANGAVLVNPSDPDANE